MSQDEYLDRAQDSERLALIARNAEVRKTMLYLANRWRYLAADARRCDSIMSALNDESMPASREAGECYGIDGSTARGSGETTEILGQGDQH